METNKLAELRKPFPANQINKLPKPTPKQKDEPKYKCEECGQYHAKGVVHLDYVGHAALTDRLLDVDPMWNWEPLSLGADGYPVIDKNGGMWIRLTVCGVTRLGYGDAQGKSGGNAVKECIGDALRNAAMRFGAALDLWHKGELHVDEDVEKPEPTPTTTPTPAPTQAPFNLQAKLKWIASASTFEMARKRGMEAYKLAETDEQRECITEMVNSKKEEVSA